MEIDDKEILEQITSHLEKIDEGEHKTHKITCLICGNITYEDGKVTLNTFEVHQARCEEKECCERDGDNFPLLLWE